MLKPVNVVTGEMEWYNLDRSSVTRVTTTRHTHIHTHGHTATNELNLTYFLDYGRKPMHLEGKPRRDREKMPSPRKRP